MSEISTEVPTTPGSTLRGDLEGLVNRWAVGGNGINAESCDLISACSAELLRVLDEHREEPQDAQDWERRTQAAGTAPQAEPATVIVVTEFVFGGGLHERRYTADGIDLEDGALAITRGSAADGDVVAVYAKNHWHHAREDGATVPGDADELRELLAEVLNDATLSPALAGWIERAQALGVKGWDGDPFGASLSDSIEEQDL